MIPDAQHGRPESMVMQQEDASSITFSFLDWRPVGGTELPFHVVIDDGERIFDYVYNRVVLE